MEIEEFAAVVFALLTVGVIAFQLALALGVPWGAYAMGGAFPGKYPPRMRVAAVAQALFLAMTALLVLSAAGIVAAPWGTTPAWAVWGVTALLVVGLVLNLITPSAGERRTWAPVIAVMLTCSAVVAILG